MTKAELEARVAELEKKVAEATDAETYVSALEAIAKLGGRQGAIALEALK